MSTSNQPAASAASGANSPGNRIVVTWHLEDFAGLTAQLAAPAESPVRAAWG